MFICAETAFHKSFDSRNSKVMEATVKRIIVNVLFSDENYYKPLSEINIDYGNLDEELDVVRYTL